MKIISNSEKKYNQPISLVIFGATGDLAQHKIVPALFDLYTKGYLPDVFHIIGFSRRDWSHEEYREFVSKSLEKCRVKCTPADRKHFLAKVFFQGGVFDDKKAYINLSELLNSINKRIKQRSSSLFYLSVPPNLYDGILKMLSKQKLVTKSVDSSRWDRVLIEKPFGYDVKSARKLDMNLVKLFTEEQIFRIDHYIAKDTLQNILAFRFSNSIFEPIMNSKSVEKIEIRMLEGNNLATRGAFYDSIGALRDVGQNHLLQILAAVTMNNPGSFNAESISHQRAILLRKLKKISSFKNHVLRGQYEDYTSDPGVKADSETETFFRIKTEINTARWHGVPIILEAGKGFKESIIDVKIHFQMHTANMCKITDHKNCGCNVLTFRLKPNEEISIDLWVKKPGVENDLLSSEFKFDYKNIEGTTADAYERVLYDAIRGDKTLFTNTEEVRASWRFISPIIEGWKNLPLIKYPKGALDSSEIN